MGNPTLLVAHRVERRPAPGESNMLAFAFPVVRCRGKQRCWSRRPADHLMKESLRRMKPGVACDTTTMEGRRFAIERGRFGRGVAAAQREAQHKGQNRTL
jgi:hypothetical protein